jgi:hypothetical protein
MTYKRGIINLVPLFCFKKFEMNDNKAFAIFIIAACSAGAITAVSISYTESQIKQKEIEFKIEQEKTKQLELQHGKDSTDNKC